MLMGMLFCTFGCKGAGGIFKILGAAAIVGSRVGMAVADRLPSGTPGDPNAGTYPRDAVTQPVAADYPLPEGCTELQPTPDAMRAMSCHGRVLVQDARSGLWRE